MASATLGPSLNPSTIDSHARQLPALFVTAYPWNLMERGLSELLDRLHGETGATGLSVWAATPRLCQLRVRDVRPRWFRTEGGLFFQPKRHSLTRAGTRSLVSNWTRSENPLAVIAEQCERAGMKMRAIFPAATTGLLAARYPEFACMNAFGDESKSAICLANPDVQEFILGLAADVTENYAVSAFILADYFVGWQEAYSKNVLTTHPLGAAAQSALGTCFCPSCLRVSEAAGVDLDKARHEVREVLNAALGDSFPVEDRTGAGGKGTSLQTHRRIQSDSVGQLLRRIVEECSRDVLIARSLAGDGLVTVSKVDDLSPVGVLTRVESADDLGAAFNPNAKQNELWVGASWAVGNRSASFVAAMAEAARLGFTAIDINNYGVLPDSALETVKQGIRFARRSAE